MSGLSLVIARLPGFPVKWFIGCLSTWPSPVIKCGGPRSPA
jgi:hypothetical protein